MSKLGRLFGVSSSSLHLSSLHEKDKDRQKSPERQQSKTPDREKWSLSPSSSAPQSPHGVSVAEFAKIASPPIPEDDVLYPLPADRKANATSPSGASVNSDSNGASANSYDHLVHPQPLMSALHDGFAQKSPPSSRPSSANSHQAPRKTSGSGPSGLSAPPAPGSKSASVSRSSSAKRKTPQSTSRSSANVSPSASQTNLPAAPPKSRFKMIEDGYHEHNLRATKRQEKLSNMLKDLLGAKKLRDEAKSAVPNILSPVQNNENKPDPEKPPTLFAGLVHQVKNNTSPYQEHGELLDPMSQQDCRSFVEKYGRCQEVIGKGSFGVVRVAHKKVEATSADEVLYAVKEFRRKPNESEKKYSRRLTSEFCISSSLKHLNIIDTLDLLKDAKGDYCEVMEFCSGGDLYTLIIAAGKLEYAEADCFFKQLIRGVNYMHDMGVAHRDLKPENLLLTQQGVLKITDFGNGECFKMAWEEEIQLSEGICGSSPYIAPEEFTQESFDPRCVDIWACGVIYMAMRTGRQLWKLADPKKDEFFQEYLTKRKDATGYEPIEALKRARCRNVIYSILDPMPNRRINGKQILNSEWGREIKVCAAGDGQLQASVLNGVSE
ncbi:uncharacterized protein CXQ87_004921 [Candidozyma duobushaemuli]|nr:uncharacterized protein CXQ87_004921 [[Candida] duobushaemulonis]PVH16626.1 hypothetical protein CXQ87_004921 [[Candida] duobushaemulonis]